MSHVARQKNWSSSLGLGQLCVMKSHLLCVRCCCGGVQSKAGGSGNKSAQIQLDVLTSELGRPRLRLTLTQTNTQVQWQHWKQSPTWERGQNPHLGHDGGRKRGTVSASEESTMYWPDNKVDWMNDFVAVQGSVFPLKGLFHFCYDKSPFYRIYRCRHQSYLIL